MDFKTFFLLLIDLINSLESNKDIRNLFNLNNIDQLKFILNNINSTDINKLLNTLNKNGIKNVLCFGIIKINIINNSINSNTIKNTLNTSLIDNFNNFNSLFNSLNDNLKNKLLDIKQNYITQNKLKDINNSVDFNNMLYNFLNTNSNNSDRTKTDLMQALILNKLMQSNKNNTTEINKNIQNQPKDNKQQTIAVNKNIIKDEKIINNNKKPKENINNVLINNKEEETAFNNVLKIIDKIEDYLDDKYINIQKSTSNDPLVNITPEAVMHDLLENDKEDLINQLIINYNIAKKNKDYKTKFDTTELSFNNILNNLQNYKKTINKINTSISKQKNLLNNNNQLTNKLANINLQDEKKEAVNLSNIEQLKHDGLKLINNINNQQIKNNLTDIFKTTSIYDLTQLTDLKPLDVYNINNIDELKPYIDFYTTKINNNTDLNNNDKLRLIDIISTYINECLLLSSYNTQINEINDYTKDNKLYNMNMEITNNIKTLETIKNNLYKQIPPTITIKDYINYFTDNINKIHSNINKYNKLEETQLIDELNKLIKKYNNNSLSREEEVNIKDEINTIIDRLNKHKNYNYDNYRIIGHIDKIKNKPRDNFNNIINQALETSDTKPSIAQQIKYNTVIDLLKHNEYPNIYLDDNILAFNNVKQAEDKWFADFIIEQLLKLNDDDDKLEFYDVMRELLLGNNHPDKNLYASDHADINKVQDVIITPLFKKFEDTVNNLKIIDNKTEKRLITDNIDKLNTIILNAQDRKLLSTVIFRLIGAMKNYNKSQINYRLPKTTTPENIGENLIPLFTKDYKLNYKKDNQIIKPSIVSFEEIKEKADNKEDDDIVIKLINNNAYIPVNEEEEKVFNKLSMLLTMKAEGKLTKELKMQLDQSYDQLLTYFYNDNIDIDFIKTLINNNYKDIKQQLYRFQQLNNINSDRYNIVQDILDSGDYNPDNNETLTPLEKAAKEIKNQIIYNKPLDKSNPYYNEITKLKFNRFNINKWNPSPDPHYPPLENMTETEKEEFKQRQKEERERLREEERQRKEEERERLKEEEQQRKEEERQRKEEEKQRLKKEEQQRKEEEKQRKEEEKQRLKEEERQRKLEIKKQKMIYKKEMKERERSVALDTNLAALEDLWAFRPTMKDKTKMSTAETHRQLKNLYPSVMLEYSPVNANNHNLSSLSGPIFSQYKQLYKNLDTPYSTHFSPKAHAYNTDYFKRVFNNSSDPNDILNSIASSFYLNNPQAAYNTFSNTLKELNIKNPYDLPEPPKDADLISSDDEGDSDSESNDSESDNNTGYGLIEKPKRIWLYFYFNNGSKKKIAISTDNITTNEDFKKALDKRIKKYLKFGYSNYEYVYSKPNFDDYIKGNGFTNKIKTFNKMKNNPSLLTKDLIGYGYNNKSDCSIKNCTIDDL